MFASRSHPSQAPIIRAGLLRGALMPCATSTLSAGACLWAIGGLQGSRGPCLALVAVAVCLACTVRVCVRDELLQVPLTCSGFRTCQPIGETAKKKRFTLVETELRLTLLHRGYLNGCRGR